MSRAESIILGVKQNKTGMALASQSLQSNEEDRQDPGTLYYTLCVTWHIISSVRGSTGWREAPNLGAELREGFWNEAAFQLRMKRQCDVSWGREKQYVQRFVFSDLNAKCPLCVYNVEYVRARGEGSDGRRCEQEPTGEPTVYIVQGERMMMGKECAASVTPFPWINYIFRSWAYLSVYCRIIQLYCHMSVSLGASTVLVLSFMKQLNCQDMYPLITFHFQY